MQSSRVKRSRRLLIVGGLIVAAGIGWGAFRSLNPYVGLKIYRNPARCYALSIPGHVQIQAEDPSHVTFVAADWTGGIQFIDTKLSVADFAKGYEDRIRKETPQAIFDPTENSAGAVRLTSRTDVEGKTVRTVSVFFPGRKSDIVHAYALIPLPDTSGASSFSDRWLSGFVWDSSCTY